MRTRIELEAGQKFGRLTLVKKVEVAVVVPAWECECECGATVTTRPASLHSGATKSCGCYKKDVQRKLMKERATTHGHASKATKSPEYSAWQAMMQRCYSPGSRIYKYYGKRGIVVCKRWHKFERFLEDMGAKPLGHTLDRVDNDKSYSKTNCRWATMKQQARNRSNNRLFTIGKQTKCLTEWAEEYGISYKTAHQRLKRGWAIEEALSNGHA